MTATQALDPRVDWALKSLEKWVAAGLKELGGRKDGQPIRELHLELTHRCNLKCVMCHHWEMPFDDPASVKREMGLAQIKGFCDEAKLLDDVQVIVLTGGEPWLKTDIVDIAAYLRGRFPGASLGILSNFWNTEMVRRRLKELDARGVKKLWLGSSLDGLEDTHDEVRGQPGAFRGLMDTVAMLRRDFPGLDFSFSFTITPRNYKELWDTYRFVTDQGLWFGAQMVVDHEKFEAPESFTWTKEQLAEVDAQIDRVILDLAVRHGALQRIVKGEERESLWLWTRLLYWWYLRKYAAKPERFFSDCLAGQRYAMFDPEGNLFFCPVNKHRTVGNVNEAKFDALWTGKAAKDERAFVDSCKCDCWLNCIANPVLDRAVALGTGSPVPGAKL
jgi:MoaA/NifB/PqqE/SkfB family radical SAM enzyme